MVLSEQRVLSVFQLPAAVHEICEHEAKQQICGLENQNTHLSDGAQQLPVAEDDHQEGHDEAEHKQADDVRDVIRCLGRPVHRAGGTRTFGAVVAPT